MHSVGTSKIIFFVLKKCSGGVMWDVQKKVCFFLRIWNVQKKGLRIPSKMCCFCVYMLRWCATCIHYTGFKRTSSGLQILTGTGIQWPECGKARIAMEIVSPKAGPANQPTPCSTSWMHAVRSTRPRTKNEQNCPKLMSNPFDRLPHQAQQSKPEHIVAEPWPWPGILVDTVDLASPHCAACVLA